MARIKIGNFMGPQGPKGEQGPIGSVGPQGPQGPAGASGQVDFVELNEEQISMITGPQGPEGPKGDNGNLSDFMVSIDDYGAIGDGVTDDSDAFNAMLSSEYTSFFIPDKTYFFNTELDVVRDDIKITCDGEMLFDVVDGTAVNITGNNNTISLNINGNDTVRIGINIDGSDNTIKGSVVKNIYSETNMTAGINTRQNGNTRIIDNVVDTVHSVGDEIGGNNNGASRAIRVTGLSTNAGYTLIENNTLLNVIGEEGDAVHLNAQDDDVMEVTVKGNIIRNFSRRGIKIQCSKTSILNNTIETYDSYEGLIRCVDLQYIHDTLIDGNTIKIDHIGAFGLNGYEEQSMKNTTITNNTIVLLSTQPALYSSYVDGLNFSNNTIIGGTGIISPRTHNVIIKNNLLTELLTTDQDYPISLMGKSTNLKLINNTLEKSTTKRSLRTNGDNVAIVGNTFLSDSSEMEISGGSGVVFNNVVKGYTAIIGDMTNHTVDSNINLPTEVV